MTSRCHTPFALSLSKGSLANPYFDKLGTNSVFGGEVA